MPVDYRKTKAPVTTVTQDIEKIEAITGNI